MSKGRIRWAALNFRWIAREFPLPNIAVRRSGKFCTVTGALGRVTSIADNWTRIVKLPFRLRFAGEKEGGGQTTKKRQTDLSIGTCHASTSNGLGKYSSALDRTLDNVGEDSKERTSQDYLDIHSDDALIP